MKKWIYEWFSGEINEWVMDSVTDSVYSEYALAKPA